MRRAINIWRALVRGIAYTKLIVKNFQTPHVQNIELLMYSTREH